MGVTEQFLFWDVFGAIVRVLGSPGFLLQCLGSYRLGCGILGLQYPIELKIGGYYFFNRVIILYVSLVFIGADYVLYW